MAAINIPTTSVLSIDQIGEIESDIASIQADVDNSPVTSGRFIGGVPFHEDDSADNTPSLNAFFEDYGTGSSKRNYCKIEYDGGVYPFSTRANDTAVIETSTQLGGALVGVGGLNPDLGYEQFQYQSALTRFTYTGSYVSGLAFIRLRQQGQKIDGIVWQGYNAATYAAAWAHYADFLDYGWYIPSSIGDDIGETYGKIHGTTSGFANFKTAIRCGTIGGDGTGQHSDYLSFPGHIWAGACGTVLHLSSIQNVSTNLGLLHCQGCGRGVYLEAGGCNTTIQHLYFGEIPGLLTYITPRAVIEIGGNPYSFNANKLNINSLSIDGSVTKTPILRSNGPGNGGTGSDIINIYGASILPSYPVSSLQDSAAAFTFRGGRTYNLYGVSYLQEGMFAVKEEGNGPPIINLFGCTMGPKLTDGLPNGTYHDVAALVSESKSLALGGGSDAGEAEINHFGTNRFGNGNAYTGWRTYTAREKYNDGVRTANQGPAWESDTSKALYFCPSVADLTSIDSNELADEESILLQGYSSPGDGGGQTLIYHTSGRGSITVDNGFYFNGPGSEDYFEAADKSAAYIRRFGASPSASNAVNGAAIRAAVAASSHVIFDAQSTSLVTFICDTPIVIDKDITLRGSGRVRIGVASGQVAVFDFNTTSFSRVIKMYDLTTVGGDRGIYIRGSGIYRESLFQNISCGTHGTAGIQITSNAIGTNWQNIDCENTGSYGFRVNGGTIFSTAKILGMHIAGTTVAGLSIENTAADGVNANGSDGVKVLGVTSEANSGLGCYVKGCHVIFHSPWWEFNSGGDLHVTSNYSGGITARANVEVHSPRFMGGTPSPHIKALNHGVNFLLTGNVSTGVVIDWQNFNAASEFYFYGQTGPTVQNCLVYFQNRAGTVQPVPNTITQLTSNTDNLSISNHSYIQSISSDASRNLTGIVPVRVGTCYRLVNEGSNNIVLKHQTTSTAANRFLCSTGADITLAASEAADLYYSGVSSRWLVWKQ